MSDRTIEETIRQLAGTDRADTVYSIDAEVMSVDEGARVCTVQSIGGKTSGILENVRLMATVDDGILLVPEVGSTVVVIYSNYSSPYISQYSNVEKIVLRGGDLGGLIKITALTAQLNERITKINAELTKIQAGIVAAGGTYTPENLQQYDKTDYENISILHG